MRTVGILATALALTAAGGAEAQMAARQAGATKNIVETAVAAGQFESLATALQVADLVSALQSKGPFTVFAPTDLAFAKLPAGTLDALLKDKAKLNAVLTYHVVPGMVTAKDLASRADAQGDVNLKTLNGAMLRIHVAGEAVHVGPDRANVSSADVMASNGVIHIMDAVVLPPQ